MAENTLNYVNPIVILEELEKTFKSDFDTLIQRIMLCDVAITPKEIEFYLEDRFKSEYPLVEKRNEERSKVIYPTISILDIEYDDFLGIRSNKEEDFKITKKYRFDKSKYELYKKIVETYRNKCLLLCSIIKYLTSNDKDSNVKELISKCDITICENKILESDMDRILLPTIYNIRKLFELTDQSNKYNAYFNDKELIGEKDIPSLELQDDNDEFGNIPLSSNQKEKLNQSKKYIIEQ